MINKEIPPYTNPADQLIKIMHSKEKPDPEDIRNQEELFDSYNNHLRGKILDSMPDLSSKSQELDVKKITQLRASGFCDQFKHLMGRSFKNLIRNTGFIQAKIGQIIVLGVVMDILFWNKKAVDYQTVRDKIGAFAFIAISQFMLSVQAVVLTCIYLF